MTMTKIYEQHDAAFNQVSAYLVKCENNQQQIRISLKYPKDGAGRLYAYVHFIGLEMVRSYAGGYGYDKKSAAISNAIEEIKVKDDPSFSGKQWYEMQQTENKRLVSTLQEAFKNIGGKDWQDVFRDIGYKVYTVI